MDRGGAETLIMNIYRNIDKSKVQFDFVTHSEKKGDYDEEIISMGGNIYRIPSLGTKGPISYIKELKKIMTSTKYSAVHAHTDYQCGFPALAAKMSGIKTRICHSHSNNWLKSNRTAENILLYFLRKIIRFSATHYCSCSLEAARFLFGEKNKEISRVRILNNGIDVSQFSNTDSKDRDSVINELGLQKEVKLIGHIGKFSPSKNQYFILKVLEQLVKVDNSFRAIFVGDGPLRNEIEKEVLKLGLKDYVLLLGVRRDIPRLMNAFDVFIFPSLFEGFGIVTIEAQSTGTPCVIADTVPKETDMGLGLVSYLNLNENLDTWCFKINEALLIKKPDKQTIENNVTQSGYNIKDNVKFWLDLYGV
ncbi:glycosyltransferase family 1 protein [Bacillus sp. T3]|uniref:glycosyltransferase family 1 protein n=1 Tax=Bacillus sp. T3 TaxID=467262 RepID=UPI002980D81B|nr:glycosyltransferase family 1 protein [Bacillus sp. T3]